MAEPPAQSIAVEKTQREGGAAGTRNSSIDEHAYRSTFQKRPGAARPAPSASDLKVQTLTHPLHLHTHTLLQDLGLPEGTSQIPTATCNLTWGSPPAKGRGLSTAALADLSLPGSGGQRLGLERRQTLI